MSSSSEGERHGSERVPPLVAEDEQIDCSCSSVWQELRGTVFVDKPPSVGDDFAFTCVTFNQLLYFGQYLFRCGIFVPVLVRCVLQVLSRSRSKSSGFPSAYPVAALEFFFFAHKSA